MDTKENEEILSVFSSFMYNRKYKIHCVDKETPIKPKNVSTLKDYKFYNKRLLNIYKTLLINKQCQSSNCETNEYINNIPNDLIELGNKFIEESILFFKREDRNEIIQKELFETENEANDESDNSLEPLENTNEIDRKFYQSNNNSTSNGTFQIIEDENENLNGLRLSLPQQRQYNLRDNSFRLKGITKNNNMSILYESDEKEDPQTK
jgi:hypothetical protein